MAMPPPRWHCHELWLQAAYVRGPPVRGLQLRTGRPAFPHDAWAWHEGSDPDICVPGGGAGGQIRREILCAGFGWATSELTGPMCCCVASTPLFSYQSTVTHYERWCLIRRPPPIQSNPKCRCHLDGHDRQTDRRLHCTPSKQSSTTATTQPKQRPDESRSPFFRLCWYPGTVCQIHPMEKLLALLAAAALLAACRVRSAGHGRNGDL